MANEKWVSELVSCRSTPSPEASAIVASSRPSEPIDHQHLERYTCGNTQLEQEVLQLFVDQLPELIDRLRNAQCPNQWKEAAHTIKGSSRAVGATKLGDIAESAEAASGDRAAFDLGDLIDEADNVTVYVSSL